MASFSHLPKELVAEIMSWLPPNSIGQAKCISKSWNTLLSGFMNDPEFVARHLHNTKNNSSTSLVVHDLQGRFSLLTLFHDDCSEGIIHGVTEDFYLPLGQEEAGEVEDVYHCDGILCLVKGSGTIMLCNPVIQEFKLLPESKIKATISDDTDMDIGFGYDSRAKDYKVVRIFYSHDVKAEVYTLQTDSWREINMNLPDIAPSECMPLCWRGVCYWLVSDLAEGRILCFDMCSEEFYTVLNPHETSLLTTNSGFFVWNESPALFLCPLVNDSSSSSESDTDGLESERIEIYVMDNFSDVGVKSLTRSVHRVTSPTEIGHVLLSWKNDELLMIDSCYQLISYNLCTKVLRNVAINELGKLEYSACSYVKSLASIRGK